MMRWTLLLSALQFGLFMLFWTALTSLLSARPYSYPVSVIGLFSLLRLVGVVAAQRTGPSRPRVVASGDRHRMGGDPGVVRPPRLRRAVPVGSHRRDRAAAPGGVPTQRPHRDPPVRAGRGGTQPGQHRPG